MKISTIRILHKEEEGKACEEVYFWHKENFSRLFLIAAEWMLWIRTFSMNHSIFILLCCVATWLISSFFLFQQLFNLIWFHFLLANRVHHKKVQIEAGSSSNKTTTFQVLFLSHCRNLKKVHCYVSAKQARKKEEEEGGKKFETLFHFISIL